MKKLHKRTLPVEEAVAHGETGEVSEVGKERGGPTVGVVRRELKESGADIGDDYA